MGELGVRVSEFSIPEIVKDCCDYITTTNMKAEGLFRVPGKTSIVQEYKASYCRGDRPKLNEVHSTAGVLKLYFRETDDAVFPAEFRKRFLAIEAEKPENRQKKILQLKGLIQKYLPMPNQLTLNYMMHFLNKLAVHAEHNKMTRDNCAMVFAPGLFTVCKDIDPMDPGQQMALDKEIQKQKGVILLVLEAYGEIFPFGPPKF